MLAYRGMPATVNHVRPRDLRSQGMDAVVDINRMLRHAVMEASEQETIPVVVAGNCNSCIGTLAGIQDDGRRIGMVWLDKHPDFHIPQTSLSGNFEGMSLAVATGDCHAEFRERIGLEQPVTQANTVLAGFWDVDPGERERLADSWINAHPAESLALFPVALDQLRERVDAVYLHIDMDFVMGVEDPARLVELVRETLPVVAVGVTNYNPDLDDTGEWRKTALLVVGAWQSRVLDTLCRIWQRSPLPPSFQSELDKSRLSANADRTQMSSLHPAFPPFRSDYWSV